jgi:NAD(P) transhydrogenase subunit alpha
MTSTGIVEFFTIFALAVFVGIEVISKVPSILHTPLMSGSNAIHGIILVGTIIVLGDAHGATEEILGFLAVLLATVNVVGGFVVTDRMLQMFKGKPQGRPDPGAAKAGATSTATATAGASDPEAGETGSPAS